MIVDEAQNLTPHEVKTIITRVGEDTKIILTGDPYQIDNPYVDSANNGLTTVVERFKDEAIAGHVTLTQGRALPARRARRERSVAYRLARPARRRTTATIRHAAATRQLAGRDRQERLVDAVDLDVGDLVDADDEDVHAQAGDERPDEVADGAGRPGQLRDGDHVEPGDAAAWCR